MRASGGPPSPAAQRRCVLQTTEQLIPSSSSAGMPCLHPWPGRPWRAPRHRCSAPLGFLWSMAATTSSTTSARLKQYFESVRRLSSDDLLITMFFSLKRSSRGAQRDWRGGAVGQWRGEMGGMVRRGQADGAEEQGRSCAAGMQRQQAGTRNVFGCSTTSTRHLACRNPSPTASTPHLGL